MGPLALDHLLVVRHQGVQFLGQGLQLAGIVAAEALGLAAAQARNLVPEVEQGPKPHAHLHEDRRHQARAQEDE